MTGASGAGALPDLRRSKLISSDGRMHVAVKREEHRGCVSYRVVPVYHDDGPDATFARRSEALRVAAAIIAEYERKIGGKHGGEWRRGRAPRLHHCLGWPRSVRSADAWRLAEL